MGYSYIWAIFLIISLSSFRFFYSVKGFEKGYLGLYKGFAMSAVIAFNSAGDSIIPYFNEGLFLSGLEEYLQENLKPFVISYRYECSFERVEPYPPGEHSNKANVDFDFTLSLVNLAHRHCEFLISESPYE